jgi:TP901 family phage tail tape measure protein
MPTNVGNLEAGLGLNTRPFDKGLANARASMLRAGQAMKAAGRKLTLGVSLPLIAAGGGAIKLAANFEKSMSKIEGLVGIAADKVRAFRSDVLRLAGETARAPQELADALFFVTSAGLRGADAIAVLEQSAKASAAGLGETKVVADLVTSAVNAYGIANLTASQATDTLVAAVREGKAEATELAQSMGQVLPIASALEVGFDQVGAAVAAMTRTGTNAATASIQLRQILASILKPTQQAEDALKTMGTSGAELRKQLREKGLISVLGFLREQMESNEQAMAQVFPNIRALSGALDIMGANAADNIGIFRRMKDNTGALDNAFGAASKTVSFQWNQTLAELKKTGIELGETLMPIFRDLLNWVQKGIKWFTALSDETKRMGLVLAGIAVLIGPTLTVLGTLATIIAGITLPIVAVIAGIAALGIAFAWIADNWEAIITRIGNWDWWKNMISGMLKTFTSFISDVINGWNFLAIASGQVGLVMANPFEELSKTFEQVEKDTESTKKEFGSLADAIVNGAAKAKKAIAGIFPSGAGGGGGAAGAGGGGGAAGAGPGAVTAQGTGYIPTIRPEIDTSSIKKAKVVIDDTKIAAFELGQAMQTTLNDAFIQLGETLANIFTGDAGVSGFFNSILLIVADFLSTFGKALISAGVAALAFEQLLVNPLAAIGAGIALIAASGVVRNVLTKGPEKGAMQGLRSGGFVMEGGLFQLHKDEVVSLPTGSAVTPAGLATNAGAAQELFAVVRGEDIFLATEEYNRKHGNSG